MEAQPEITQNISSLKLPMLKTRDYDLWSMRMEQYLTHTNYALWKVIINGDSPVPEPPVVAILDDHLLKFHSIKDAKSLWEAIKIRFGGNKESKKMHKTILKQQYENFEDANMKLLGSLPSACNNIALIMRNKHDIETLSMDDLYNNLKVYEAEIKGQSSSSSNSHNVAFVSFKNTSNVNETVNAAHDIHAAGSKEQPSASNYADDLEEAIKGKDDLKEKLTRFEESSKNLTKLIYSQMSANEKTGLGYDSKLSKNEMPKCEIFKAASDSSVSEIDEDNNQAKDSVNHLIKDCTFYENKIVEKSMVKNKGKGIGQREVRPVRNNARRVNHQNFSKMTHPHPKRNFVPTAAATKLGHVLVNAAKQSSAASTSTARPKGNPQYTLQDQGIFDGECSRHMMGNKSFLIEYQEIDGGFVAF
nr:ribonuclease H-like domain-containing protein [Tanacetum cinerariifolium]